LEISQGKSPEIERPGFLTLFHRTLHKIHTFVGAQHDGNKIKNFFRQTELNTLLKDCRSRLEHALDMFQVVTAHNPGYTAHGTGYRSKQLELSYSKISIG
jgi:hypothetical protein